MLLWFTSRRPSFKWKWKDTPRSSNNHVFLSWIYWRLQLNQNYSMPHFSLHYAHIFLLLESSTLTTNPKFAFAYDRCRDFSLPLFHPTLILLMLAGVRFSCRMLFQKPLKTLATMSSMRCWILPMVHLASCITWEPHVQGRKAMACLQ